MKLNQIKNNLLHTGVAIALVTGMAAFTLPSAYAGGKITIDDTKWISIGMGMRFRYIVPYRANSAGMKFNGNGKKITVQCFCTLHTCVFTWLVRSISTSSLRSTQNALTVTLAAEVHSGTLLQSAYWM